MKTLLVPTDFSKTARNAALYAIKLAKDINANVALFHAYHVPLAATEVPIVIITAEELQEEDNNSLKKEAEWLKKKTGIEVNYSAKLGFAVEEILAEEKNATLIVMGIQGAGKISETLIGSTATAVMRKAKIPVLIIPENTGYKKPQTIAFACDYDPKVNLHTFETLKILIENFKAKVYILNVKQRKESFIAEERMSTKLDGNINNVEHIYYFPEKEDLVDGINEFVKNKNVDMVVIIPHRYDMMERLFHKSISKKMAFHTHVPLLALPDLHKAAATYFV